MVYPGNFEQKTGFDSIRQMIVNACLSTLGKYFAKKMHFSSQIEIIGKLLDQTEEFRQLYLFDDPFPSQDYFDLTSEFDRLKAEGTYIPPEQLLELKLSLRTLLDVIYYLTKRNKKYPALLALTVNIYSEDIILRDIELIINEKGEIHNHASPELSKIRKDIQSKVASVERKVYQSLSLGKKEGWLVQDAEITIRNGRLVIPVPASYKRKIKGYIHDESATGQTVFIEPSEAFETNNAIRELEIAERHEIIRILTLFTDTLRPQLSELIQAYRFLGLVDFIRAKALVSVQLNAIRPDIHNKPLIQWKQAVHPLLFLSHQLQNKKVVPLDISLDDNERILVISGPNAGGKSVCLKTAGLLQYMLQCGLLIPVKEASEAGIFHTLFIDIGDEQSLENDLSTYSSHLLNLKNILKNADKNTLFLIDEFGTGTDPHLGGAIAEAVLEELSRKNSMGIVTTHYSNLKLLAEKTAGIINGAMLFDNSKMQPLYLLKIGKPGSSFAFEIARNIGFPEKILQNAAEKTGTSQLDYEQCLTELETEKLALEKEFQQLRAADTLLSELIAKYKKLYNDLDAKKKEIISSARFEAKNLLTDASSLIEKTIKEIRENQAEKSATKAGRQEIKALTEKLQEATPQIENTSHDNPESISLQNETESPKSDIETPLRKGDKVCIIGQDFTGEILEIDDEEALVAFENFKIKTLRQHIERASEEPKEKRKTGSRYSGIINDINAKTTEFSLRLDVRGQRAEAALNTVQKYIDEAILLGVFEVNILHGKGNGILRHLIREYLSTVREIKQFYDERIEFGGHGITIVKFR
ncbi:MAG: Smr/MutS family protein [Lentimicrobiaceae bacterium]|nr:Smr/MutS family protein [Lentimicrobiaceae bacterium]